MRIRAFLSVLTLVVLAAPAAAQKSSHEEPDVVWEQSRWNFEVGMSAEKFDENDQYLSTAVGGYASLGYEVMEGLGFSVTGGYMGPNVATKILDDCPLCVGQREAELLAQDGESVDLWHGRLGMRWSFPSDSRLTPELEVGLGVAKTTSDAPDFNRTYKTGYAGLRMLVEMNRSTSFSVGAAYNPAWCEVGESETIGDAFRMEAGLRWQPWSTFQLEEDEVRQEVALLQRRREVELAPRECAPDDQYTPDEIPYEGKYLKKDLVIPLKDDAVRHAGEHFGRRLVKLISGPDNMLYLEVCPGFFQPYELETTLRGATG